MHIHRVIEVDAGENREDEGLKNCDHELKAREGNHEADRRDFAPHRKHDREARKHLQHRVAGHHVGEQTNRVADRANEVGNQFDRYDHRHQQQGHAFRHEQLQIAEAMLRKAYARCNEPDHSGDGERYDDVARDREAARDHAEQIQNENENEDREDPREVGHAVLAEVFTNHVGNEFVKHLCDRLDAARHQRAATHGEYHEAGDQRQGEDHHQRRVRKRNVVVAQLKIENLLDLELVHRAMSARAFCSQGFPLPVVVFFIILDRRRSPLLGFVFGLGFLG